MLQISRHAPMYTLCLKKAPLNSLGLTYFLFYRVVSYLISSQSFMPCMALNSLSVLMCR